MKEEGEEEESVTQSNFFSRGLEAVAARFWGPEVGLAARVSSSSTRVGSSANRIGSSATRFSSSAPGRVDPVWHLHKGRAELRRLS